MIFVIAKSFVANKKSQGMATLAEVEVVIRANLEPLIASSKGAEKRIVALEKKLTQAGRSAAPAFRAATSEVDKLRSSVSRFATAVGAAFSVREIKQYADEWTNAGNKIRAAAQSAGVQTRSLESLNRAATDARTSLGDYADLYARLIRSASAVAKSEQEIATVTETVSKAFKAGGANATEAAAGIMQLGQALGSGVLQGDELRSLRENAPVLAQAIADEFKTTIAGLKQLGNEGKLTSEKVFAAILKAAPEIRNQFNTTNATISDGFVNLRNKLVEYIGSMNETYGITQTVNRILGSLSSNIENVANAAAAAGIVLLASFGRGSALATAGALLNPWVALAAAIGAVAYALTDVKNEIVPISGSFAELQDYATAAWSVLGDGVDVLSSAFSQFSALIATALGGAQVSLADLASFAKATANRMIGVFVAGYEILAATFTKLPAAIADGVISAVNFMIDKINNGIKAIVDGVNVVIRATNALASKFGAGDLVGEIKFSGLSGLENTYAGAGKKAGDAYMKAFDAQTRDYLGGAVEELTKRANAAAADRLERERLNREIARSETGSATETGFGKGIESPLSSGKKGKKGKKKTESEYKQAADAIRERTAALMAEYEAQQQVNPLVNDYGYTIEKARVAHELLTAAQKAGIAITPELRAQIDQLAEGYANATVSAAQLAEQQERVKQEAEEMKSFGKDVLGGFIQDLRSGKSGAEALANALNKVADKLLEIGLNTLFSGSGSGGKGLFGGLLSSLFGGFFADGGNPPVGKVSVVGERGPELFVPKQSGVIIPNSQLKPNVGNQPAKAQPVDVRVSVDQNGNLQAYVNRTAEKVTARGTAALAQRVPAMAMGALNDQNTRGVQQFRKL